MSDNGFQLLIVSIIAVAVLGLAALFLYAPTRPVDHNCLIQAVEHAVYSCTREAQP